MTRLYLYLNGVWMVRPFVWGEFDCVLSVCDWVSRNGYDNPGQEFLYKYSNRLECDELCGIQSNPTGFVKFLVKRCFQVGLKKTNVPVKGDIGIARTDGQLAAGIKLKDTWAFKAETGVTLVKPESVLVSFSVGYED